MKKYIFLLLSLIIFAGCDKNDNDLYLTVWKSEFVEIYIFDSYKRTYDAVSTITFYNSTFVEQRELYEKGKLISQVEVKKNYEFDGTTITLPYSESYTLKLEYHKDKLKETRDESPWYLTEPRVYKKIKNWPFSSRVN